MLSRSNSSAGSRLRRAKSTSSAHTTSSGHLRVPTTIDPYAFEQQHAEIAALEAYRRRHPLNGEITVSPSHRAPIARKPVRRSQVTGKTEGSHFEDARLGRRKSTSRKSSVPKLEVAVPQQQQQDVLKSEYTTDGRKITRKRSIIPPSMAVSSAPLSREITSAMNEIPWSIPGAWPNAHTMLSSYENFQAKHNGLSDRAPTNEASISTESRPECRKQLRERRSFIAGTLQKLRAPSSHKALRPSYDLALPPFNYAGSDFVPQPQPPRLPTPPSRSGMPNQGNTNKSRTFSDSLKKRVIRAFRRSSRIPSSMPAQQVEAKQIHYPIISLRDVNLPIPANDDYIKDYDQDHFAQLPAESQAVNLHSPCSTVGNSTTKSRVTSWTNSTVARTCSGTENNKPTSVVSSSGSLKRSESLSTLMKAGSVLARPIKAKLRRSDEIQLNSSEESEALYTALQDHIKTSASPQSKLGCENDSISQISNGRSSLPSQQRRSQMLSLNSAHSAGLPIRTVTPENPIDRADALSPVVEVLSPSQPYQQSDLGHDAAVQASSSWRSRIHRRHAIKSTIPSKEQIAQRIERSQNRWQAPLDETSPLPSLSKRLLAIDDNPYELRSVNGRNCLTESINDLPHHAKIHRSPDHRKKEVLSPSLYSQNLGSRTPSPTVEKPSDFAGTVVTITGREVRSYPISPAKCSVPVHRPAQPSQEWRNWLSGELKEWDGARTADLLPFSTPIRDQERPVEVEQAESEKNDHHETKQSPTTPDLHTVSARQRQSSNKAHRPGFMNDRYPFLDTKRAPSGNTTAASYNNVPTTSLASSKKNSPILREIDSDDLSGISRKIPKSDSWREKNVFKQASAVELRQIKHEAHSNDQARFRQRSNEQARERGDKDPSAGESLNQHDCKARARSALDLRAHYSTGRESPAKPLEVRRKRKHSVHASWFEDDTILDISAGPYASSKGRGSAHSRAVKVMASDLICRDKENSPIPEASSACAKVNLGVMSNGTKKGKNTGRGTPHTYTQCYHDNIGFEQSGSAHEDSDRGSPGQRLATGWLDARRLKGHSPAAFV